MSKPRAGTRSGENAADRSGSLELEADQHPSGVHRTRTSSRAPGKTAVTRSMESAIPPARYAIESSLPPSMRGLESCVPPSKQRARSGWTVVEEFERDGYSYQVLRRPLDTQRGHRLTKRQEQVLEHACEGHSNKSIAYALGLSPSTVGVLLYRAAAKLGAKDRFELLAAYLRLKSKP
jgi:DNA-binding CsgD family transcriptional regulator